MSNDLEIFTFLEGKSAGWLMATGGFPFLGRLDTAIGVRLVLVSVHPLNSFTWLTGAKGEIGPVDGLFQPFNDVHVLCIGEQGESNLSALIYIPRSRTSLRGRCCVSGTLGHFGKGLLGEALGARYPNAGD